MLVDHRFQESIISAYTDHDFHLATVQPPRSKRRKAKSVKQVDTKDDHILTAVDIAFFASHKEKATSPKVFFSKGSLRNPDVQREVARELQSLPLPPWQVDVDTHVNYIVQQVHNILSRCAPPLPVPKRKTSISDDTFKHIQTSTYHKTRLRQAHRFHGKSLLRAVFKAIQSFNAVSHHVSRRFQQEASWSLCGVPTSHKNAAWHQYQVACLSLQIASGIAADRDKFLNDLGASFVQSQRPGAHVHIWRALKQVAPGLDKKGGPRPIPALQISEGVFAENFRQAADKWTDHFCGIEKGFKVEFQELITHAQDARYFDGRVFPELQADCITTPFDIEQKALNVTCGRASGPDQIPPELVMCNPKAIARLLAPLGLKTTGRVCEPYQWSGGKYKELYKRSGVQSLVESFRAILLSDIFGKMLQGPLRTKTVNFATDFFGDYQFAELPGKGCDLALHALLAFMEYAAFLQVSSIHIFVDCHNAFYSMLRSLVLEYGDNDQILAYVIQRMGLPQDVASEILEACHRPPAARLAMLPPHLQAVLQQHYSASWLFVEGASNPARTTTGSKPGIPAADICFMLIFARVTNEIRETFCTLGHAEQVLWSGYRFPPNSKSETTANLVQFAMFHLLTILS